GGARQRAPRGRVSAVEFGAPVVGDVAAWDWLVLGAGFRRGELGAVVVLGLAVVPEPVLARLEAADDRVTARGRVGGGVLGRGRVTAADVAALGTTAEVEPPAVDLQTVR